MQNHTLIGAEALTTIVKGKERQEQQAFLDYAREMTISHHQRWDGDGYPKGLKGRKIPLAVPLMSLADVYDALISKRVYKKGMTHEEVCDFIIQQSGKQFDPDVVAAFMIRNQELFKIAQQFADP